MSVFVNTVDSIGDEALTNSIIDRSITEIQDNYATSIGKYAFYYCTALTTADFQAVTSIGDNAFQSCSALTTVDFPAVTSIGNSVFANCSALTKADFPAVTSIGNTAFSYCSALTTADFPAATSIGNSAFQYCPKLTTADFPTVTSIGLSAFYKCSALTTTNFPAVTSIGNSVFANCSALTKADFPAVTSIGNSVFFECSKLTTLILRSATMATLGNTHAFESTPIASGTGYIYVPAALVDSYKAASNWSTYANQIRAIEDYPDICDPYTWEAVAKHIELGDYATFYKVGDCVPLDLGSEGVVNMQIAAFDADDLADGSGKAPISWISKELLSTTRHMNPSDSGSGVKGGWETCEMRTYLQTTIKPLISGNIAKIIVPVTKQHEAYSASGSYIANQITTDELWIPSKPEVYGGSRLYLGLFNNVEERTKYLAGGTTPTAWWLRSTNSSSRFDYVDTNGSIYGAEVYTKYGVCLGFCT